MNISKMKAVCEGLIAKDLLSSNKLYDLVLMAEEALKDEGSQPPHGKGRIVDYTIIRNFDITFIANEVRELIKYGWEPLGGIAVCTDSDGRLCFSQAMIRRERQED